MKLHEAAALMESLFALQPSHDYLSKMGDIVPLFKNKEECCKKEGIDYLLSTDSHGEEKVLQEFVKFAPEEGKRVIDMFENAIQKNTLRVRKETRAKVEKETTERVRKEDELRLLRALEKQGLNINEIEAIMARFKAGK